MPYADPEKAKENLKKRVARYRQTAKGKTTLAKWLDENGREYKRKWMAEKRAAQPNTIRRLSNSYVRDTLTSRSPLHRSEIPPDLVEAQRIHLQLKREIRKLT
jgi:DNA-binding PadR family transcriptional regulator